MPRQTWRLIVTPPASGAENMALDEALMDRARQTGEWVLRVYSWRAPTISLGRNQSARGRYDLDRIQTLGFGCRSATDGWPRDSARPGDYVQCDCSRWRRRGAA